MSSPPQGSCKNPLGFIILARTPPTQTEVLLWTPMWELELCYQLTVFTRWRPPLVTALCIKTSGLLMWPTVISSLLYSKDPLRNLPFKDPASPQRLGHSEAGKILLWDLFQYFCSTPVRGLRLLMIKSTHTAWGPWEPGSTYPVPTITQDLYLRPWLRV